MPEELTLALAVMDGSESSFDEQPLQPGVHLRWAFSRYLPYPRAGFLIERLLPWLDEFGVGSWERVATVMLPTTVTSPGDRRARAIAEARARVDQRLSGAFGGRRDDLDYGALIDLLLSGWPQADAPADLPVPSGGGPQVAAQRLELLQLAALDSRAAVAIGLSYIDPLLAGVRASYRVTGLWGSETWPWNTVLASHARDRARTTCVAGDVRLESDRRRARDAAGRVTLEGTSDLPLIITLPLAARHVAIRITSSQAGDWAATCWGVSEQRLSDARFEYAGSTARIQSASALVREIHLRQLTTVPAIWTLISVSYRLGEGAIGNRSAERSLRLTRDPAIGLHVRARLSTSVAGAGAVGPVPRAGAGAVQVDVVPTGERPTSVHVTRDRVDAVIPEAQPLTRTAVAPGPVPSVLARYTLDGTEAGVTRNGAAAFRVGGADRRPVLLLSGGFAVLRDARLMRLGADFAIEIWVRPWPAAGTFLAHDGLRRFSLALDAASRLVHVQIDGTAFSGRTPLLVERWVHIALVVHGSTAQLYVNGLLDATHAVREPTGIATDRMALGAPATATAGSFTGALADVLLITHALRPLDPIPEDLAAAWSLDGHTRGTRTESALTPHGTVRFVTGHPETPTRRAVQLDGSTWLSAPSLQGLGGFDTELTLEAWVRPEPGQSWPTIFGNEWRSSVWLGLTPDGYRIRFRVNGNTYESRTGIAGRGWSHVAASTDGRVVRLWIDGRLDTVHAAPIGPFVSSARATFTIGADNEEYPFRGCIADARVWRCTPRPAQRLLLAGQDVIGAWPLAGNISESARGLDSILVGGARFEAGHPLDPERQVLLFDGRTYLEVAAPLTLAELGSALTIDAWIRPGAEAEDSTIMSQEGDRGFALAVTADARARLRINGHELTSTGHVTRRFWCRVTAVYDGTHAHFYLQQQTHESQHAAALGPVSRDAPVRIGADRGSTPATPVAPFRGALADVRVFSRALDPAQCDAAAALAQPAATLLDRDVPVGRFRYHVEPTDVFGRVGTAVASPAIAVQDQVPPPPPGAVRARFVPLRGAIMAVRRDDTGPAVTVVTDIPVPADSSVRAHLLSHIVGYEAQLRGVVAARERDERVLIRLAHVTDGNLVLTVEPPPLARLLPDVGHRIEIEYDTELDVRWAWTGIQRVSAPDVSTFRVYDRAGASDTVEAGIAMVTRDAADPELFAIAANVVSMPRGSSIAEWVGRYCLVDSHRYRIESATLTGSTASLSLRYLARPVIVPEAGARLVFAIPISAAGRDNAALSNARRTVVPEAGRLPAAESFEELTARRVSDEAFDRLRSDLREVTPPRDTVLMIELPSGATAPQRGEPEGAVLGFSMDERTWGWIALRVIAAQAAAAVTTLFLLRPAEREPGGDFVLRRVRYLRGAWMSHTLHVAPNIPRDRGLQSYEIAVTAADRAPTPDPRGGPEAPGNESALSTIVRAIAVDRRRPPPLPAPTVSFDAADFFGESRATLDWRHIASESGTTFELHRATDTDVFTADLRQRRRREGIYSPARRTGPSSVFEEDLDFEPWLAARFPDWAARSRDDLFIREPASEADRTAWDSATEVWRAWAERYYLALGDRDVGALAELPGNEAAFVSVTPKPVKGAEHVDIVRGLADNRFLYRLRARTASFVGGESLGSASLPARAPRVRPPRPPVFTKVEGADRMIRLDWAVSQEPNFAAYRVYRAESAAALDDLRWFGPGDDERLIAPAIEDPLIRVRGREVVMPAGLEVDSVAGVHRLDEFDTTRPPAEQTAFNYRAEATAIADGVIRELRPIADGLPVAIVFRGSDGTVGAVTRRATIPPFLDSDVVGVRDYFYRLQAVDRFGNVSDGSKIAVARAADLSPAPPPVWTRAAWVTRAGERSFVELEWTVPAAGMRCIVQRRSDRESTWSAVGEWLDTPDTLTPAVRFSLRDRSATPARAYQYRVRAVSPAGNPNAEHNVVDVPPLEA